VLDAQAKAAYRRRMVELCEELDEAEGAFVVLAGDRVLARHVSRPRSSAGPCPRSARLSAAARRPRTALACCPSRILDTLAGAMTDPEVGAVAGAPAAVGPRQADRRRGSPSRAAILDQVERLVQAGVSLLYTSHYIQEVERVSTRVGIIDHGRIIAEGTSGRWSPRSAARTGWSWPSTATSTARWSGFASCLG
jgi:hypothetical protein